MFARKFRLPATVKLTSSRSIYTQSFTFTYKENMLLHNRYGFVVSKKINKKATARNFLKRRFRRCVETLHDKLSFGKDILFILKKEAETKTTEQLCQDIQSAFITAGILKRQ